ncbi:uncharacterized protein FTJAE_1620 [Fusarium tjaetaba]|uniref:Uncharacterized protein n=1 Tax=Fusarium tjaetaba TaxID=1567544 RepID=A0A8H5SAN3_9HYPO|nr:uncharacterized protein FTJAE_1620 [Fusarium tjaetaba]KAF5647564.1 hypothetical protein FTJAE_1620 [Fusarium tjaetaba]
MFMDEDFSISDMEEAMEEEDEGEEYQQESALERIWVASCWKFPWLHDPVQLTPRLSLDDTTKASVRASTARAFGIPELATLPPEVLQMIKSFAPHHSLWKFSSIQNVAESMSSSGTDIESYPLASIKSWQRGQPVVCDKDDLKNFVLRLTVDRDGLKQIEKLESWPEYSQVRSNAFAYLFVVPFRATKAHVDFKLGRAFLKKEIGFGYGEFWDTPNPPEKGLSMFATPLLRFSSTRFRTVDLCNITGLTFFYFRGYIMGVHAHTADSPAATSTFNEISAIDPKYLMWAYVPISRKDSLMRIGVRDTLTIYVPPTFLKPTVLISTKLAGEFALGPDYGYAEEVFLSEKEPTVFVYNVPHKRGYGMYGAVSDQEGDEPSAPFPRLFPSEEGPPYRGRIHFEAPAKGIVHVDVYYNEANGYCKGLLLEYANGAQRALGQCRVGVDRFKAHEHGSNDFDDWVCMPTTKGYLRFGCDHKIASLDMYTLRSEEEEDE